MMIIYKWWLFCGNSVPHNHQNISGPGSPAEIIDCSLMRKVLPKKPWMTGWLAPEAPEFWWIFWAFLQSSRDSLLRIFWIFCSRERSRKEQSQRGKRYPRRTGSQKLSGLALAGEHPRFYPSIDGLCTEIKNFQGPTWANLAQSCSLRNLQSSWACACLSSIFSIGMTNIDFSCLNECQWRALVSTMQILSIHPMDWFKGKLTGKPDSPIFYGKISGFL